MVRVALEMANEPLEEVDLKFGVHGGGGDATATNDESGSRHRLSISLEDGGCEITWPKAPQGQIQTAYAASYPGKLGLLITVFLFFQNYRPIDRRLIPKQPYITPHHS